MTEKSNPLLTVIVPTYNRADMVVRTIDSLLCQTYDFVEIIVVDDGSTDNTHEVIEGLIETNGKAIRYFKKNNGGCASARNKGLEMSSGDLIAFLDSDDSWLPTAAETLVTTLLNSGADLVYSPAIEVFPDGREVINYPTAFSAPELLAMEHFKESNVRNGSYLLRRELLESVGRFDEGLHHNEDSDFFQRAAIHAKVAYSDAPTVKVYTHMGNKSKNRVAIYGALLKSSERILAENPSFASSLGSIADERVFEIKTHLIRAHSLSGNFDEAEALANNVERPLGLPLRLAILSRSRTLFKLEAFYIRRKRQLLRLFDI